MQEFLYMLKLNKLVDLKGILFHAPILLVKTLLHVSELFLKYFILVLRIIRNSDQLVAVSYQLWFCRFNYQLQFQFLKFFSYGYSYSKLNTHYISVTVVTCSMAINNVHKKHNNENVSGCNYNDGQIKFISSVIGLRHTLVNSSSFLKAFAHAISLSRDRSPQTGKNSYNVSLRDQEQLVWDLYMMALFWSTTATTRVLTFKVSTVLLQRRLVFQSRLRPQQTQQTALNYNSIAWMCVTHEITTTKNKNYHNTKTHTI